MAKNTKNIPITMENFELIADKYNHLIMGTIRQTNGKFVGYQKIDYEDYHQEALIVLFNCIRNYSPEKGCTFGVYFQYALKNGLIQMLKRYIPHNFNMLPEKINGKSQWKIEFHSTESLHSKTYNHLC